MNNKEKRVNMELSVLIKTWLEEPCGLPIVLYHLQFQSTQHSHYDTEQSTALINLVPRVLAVPPGQPGEAARTLGTRLCTDVIMYDVYEFGISPIFARIFQTLSGQK